MNLLKSHISQYDLTGKRVLLRADLNVPLQNGIIHDDFRLQSLLPTIQLLRKKGAKVIIATHIGRPTQYDAALSTKNLIPWFQKHGYYVDFEPDIAAAIDASFDNFDALLLIDNLRFFPGEKERDPHFAKLLAELGDFYVNDAFGALHRNDASLTLTPKFFDYNHRSIGLLVEKELEALHRLLKNPSRPFVVALGGGKLHDKIPVIKKLIKKADTILIGPALSYTFDAAQGKEVGRSLIDTHALPLCNEIIKYAKAQNTQLIFPVDFLVSYTDLFDTNLHIATADNFPPNALGVTIGPQTQALFASIIESTKQILVNGLMGTVKNNACLQALDPFFNALTRVPESIVAGGDSVAAARLLGYGNTIGFLSTGGGSVLSILSGQELPALKPFIHTD